MVIGESVIVPINSRMKNVRITVYRIPGRKVCHNDKASHGKIAVVTAKEFQGVRTYSVAMGIRAQLNAQELTVISQMTLV